jgi:hypothetical protein
VKTGRLLKFHRPGGEVHAYLYNEGPLFRASVYLMSSERGQANEPLARLQGASEIEVEAEVRAWLDAHYPKA